MQHGKLNISKWDRTTAYTQIEDIITSIANKTISKYRIRKQPMMITDILDLCDKKRTLKQLRNTYLNLMINKNSRQISK